VSVQPARNRLQYLLSPQSSWNGIDYVEIASTDQTHLRVHFLNATPVEGTFTAVPPVTICGGETIPSVPVDLDGPDPWSVDEAGRPILSLVVPAPGDFSTYTLTIHSSALDPFFDEVQFSFKANCPSQLDCQAPSPGCAGPDDEPTPINYLAKDFESFKQALSDYSALRYPSWVERSEADVGVMLMEALSAIADELSYLQDRVAAEATLGTATQRVSLIRHARLVDYEPTPAIAATTTLQLDVADGVTAVQSGLRCSALGAGGQAIPFEVGAGLADPSTGQLQDVSYAVDSRWNGGPPDAPNLNPYWWDDTRQCLAASSTELWIIGQGYDFGSGQQLLLDTAGPTSADPPVREIVTIGTASDDVDPLFYVPLTRVVLQAPTTLDHDLSRTRLAGNLLPAIQGARTTEVFSVPGNGAAAGAMAVVRTAANWTPQDPRPDYRYTLRASQLSWLPAASSAYLPALAPPDQLIGHANPTGGSLATGTYAYQVTAINPNVVTSSGPAETVAAPEVTVKVNGPTGSVTLIWNQVQPAATYNVYGRTAGTIGKLATVGPFDPTEPATYTDSGLTAPNPDVTPPAANNSGGAGDYTPNLDINAAVEAVPQIALSSSDPAVIWRWQRWLLGSGPADTVFTLTPESYSAVGAGSATTWFDYDGEGTTIRFGDGTFGLTPTADTMFTAIYVAGGGAVGNVPADTIVRVERDQPQAALISSVTNPFAASGGSDEETPQQIRDRAPQAFRANPLRVVLPADYVTAAESLPWVQQAGTDFRWTGSWLTVFTTADPAADEGLTIPQLEQLSELLGRRRLAGYESYVLGPSYASVDLQVALCAQPTAFASDVEAAVLTALRPGLLPDGSAAFFNHSNWSFGDPLESSALLAALQQVPGVLGVTSVSYRLRGIQGSWASLPETLTIAPDRILRMDDDPSRPENGSLQITVEGGK
jgi:Baseplate J-like protein